MLLLYTYIVTATAAVHVAVVHMHCKRQLLLYMLLLYMHIVTATAAVLSCLSLLGNQIRRTGWGRGGGGRWGGGGGEKCICKLQSS